MTTTLEADRAIKGDEFFQRLALQPPFNRLTPALAGFLKEYFRYEKVIRFGGQSVVNTNFPPFPSAAMDRLIENYQRETAIRPDLPILSSLAYVVSLRAFGCGAGLTHLYIDGSGEVCPCNLVPLSFGNIQSEPLERILETMAHYFRQSRTGCLGKILARRLAGLPLPTPPATSREICERYLPETHPRPHGPLPVVEPGPAIWAA
jgi:MoaA/NifB/PqqE/SkfB family radical SAM enzyme